MKATTIKVEGELLLPRRLRLPALLGARRGRARTGCGRASRGGGRPTGRPPPDAHCEMMSTRRFWALPSAVLLLAIGFVLPNASVLIRLPLIPALIM